MEFDRRRAAGASRPLYSVSQGGGVPTGRVRTGSRVKQQQQQQPGKVHLVNADSLVAMVHELVEQVADFNARLHAVECVALPSQDLGGEIDRLGGLVNDAVRKSKQVENSQKHHELRAEGAGREVSARLSQLEYLVQCDVDQRKVIEPRGKHRNIFEYCKMMQKEVLQTSTELATLRQELKSVLTTQNKDAMAFPYHHTTGPMSIGDLACSRDPRVDELTARLDLLEATFESQTLRKTSVTTDAAPPGPSTPTTGFFELLTSPQRKFKPVAAFAAAAHRVTASEHDDLVKREETVLLKEEMLQQKEAALDERLRRFKESESIRIPTPEEPTRLSQLLLQSERSSTKSSVPSSGVEMKLDAVIGTVEPEPTLPINPSPKSVSSRGTNLVLEVGSEPEPGGLALRDRSRESSVASRLEAKLAVLEAKSRESVGSEEGSTRASMPKAKGSSAGSSRNPSPKEDAKAMDLASLLDALTSKPAPSTTPTRDPPPPPVVASSSGYSRHTSSSSLTLDSIQDDSPDPKRKTALGVGHGVAVLPTRSSATAPDLTGRVAPHRPHKEASQGGGLGPLTGLTGLDSDEDSDPLTM